MVLGLGSEENPMSNIKPVYLLRLTGDVLTGRFCFLSLQTPKCVAGSEITRKEGRAGPGWPDWLSEDRNWTSILPFKGPQEDLLYLL